MAEGGPNFCQGGAEDLPFYFPHFKKHGEIRKTLLPYIKKDGCFLLRDSLRTKGALTISVTHGGEIRHMVILEENNKYMLQDVGFKTVAELIEHYSVNDVPNLEGLSHIRFLHPVLNEKLQRHRSLPAAHATRINTRAERKLSAPEVSTLPDPTNRPPVPIPRDMVVPPALREEEKDVYIYAREPMDRSDTLLHTLKKQDSLRCTCGLLVSESRLPDGWTVHQSTEAMTKGRLFYVSPDNESTWELPDEIAEQLSKEQMERLKRFEQNQEK